MAIFKRAANWLFGTPEGLLTLGIVYGASMTALWYSSEKDREQALEDAYFKGVDKGFELAENGINPSDLVEFSYIHGKKVKKLHKTVKVNVTIDDKKDNGAESPVEDLKIEDLPPV